jgi:hypothetical protein
MRTSPPLRPVIIAGLASLIAGIVFAVTVGGSASFIFLGLGPVMAVVTVAERLLERRTLARDQMRELVAQWSRQLSPQQFLATQPRPLSWWQVGLPTPELRLIRVGVVTCSKASVLRGSGAGVCDRVISIDARGGIWVRGEGQLARAAAAALRLALAREFSPQEPRPAVVEGAMEVLDLRWELQVDEEGFARLFDRLANENPVEGIIVDLLPESDASVVEMLQLSQATCSLVDLDIVARGPHALVSGTTGSGKTEFLVAWLAQQARTHQSDELALVIVDFKGGGSFVRLAPLPHLRHLVPDLDDPGLHAAFEGLLNQISLRELAMRNHGVASIGQISPSDRPVRLVLVIDEFRALIRSMPQWKELLTDLAARGRALGIHLVLATQRFGSLSADEITANIELRIVFRPGEAAESHLLLGSSVAWDHALKPGQALVSWGRDPARVLEFSRWLPTPAPPLAMSEHSTAEPAAWLWCEPLRERPRGVATSGPEDALFLGLRADHELRSHVPVRWSPASDGLLLAIGSDRTTRIDVARVVEHATGRVLRLPAEPALAWDAIERALDEPEQMCGLIAPELDSCVGRMAPAWRDDFTDRLINVCHGLIARGLPVVVGLGAEASLSSRLTQLPHCRVDTAGPEGVARMSGNTCVVADPHLEPLASPSAAGNAGNAGDAGDAGNAAIAARGGGSHTDQSDKRSHLDGWVVTARRGYWRNIPQTRLRVVSIDELLALTYSAPVNLETTRVLVDDCSPAEFRALRLSSRVLGPPHPNTVTEVLPDGRLCRLDISGLDDGANFSDGASATENVEVQLTRDQADISE